ncbi:unnamed protein product [Rotaria sp. Silwood1]|nr:unnamed protein product [Rotaria sp. Silwood1]
MHLAKGSIIFILLNFGLTYCPNGDLLQYITDAGHLNEETVRFYAAELIEALEQLQKRHIVHRDLKPENILLTDDMHIQLTDFGSGVIIDNSESQSDHSKNVDGEKKLLKRTNSFVGTAQFVAPEILKRGAIHFGSDLWSLGCIIYQMATGKHLFRGHHEYDIYNAVVRVSYKLSDDFPTLLGDLVQKLVRLEPHERLGSEETGGMKKLKEHPFFSEFSYDTKWDHLLNQRSPLEAKLKLSSRPQLSDDELKTMSSGFDARVEARLIGLRMAADGPDELSSIITRSLNLSLSNDRSSLQETHYPNSLSDQSTRSSSYTSPSSNGSFNNNINAPVTARRLQLPDHTLSLSEQASKNIYHKFVQNNLIIKQGILDKKKGLFARRRMFLITEGPAIFYVDPDAMELKGTISWTADLRIEQKDMKTFLIHVPGRTYHLTDPDQDATTWCKSLTSIHCRYYNTDPNRKLSTMTTYSSASSSSGLQIIAFPQINLDLTDWTNDNESNIVLQHDCLHVAAWIEEENDPYQIISYCMSEWPSKWKFQKNNQDQNFTFVELYKLNITSEQLYLWSAPMDVVEHYQFYLNLLLTSNTSSSSMVTYMFYNCTSPRFGPLCQYSLDAYKYHHLTLNEIIREYYLHKYEPTTLTCYTHLQCDRGSIFACLDWSEICDGVIDCRNGIDEESCWQFEINECEDNEVRCLNGQCISKTFFHDDPNGFECLDRSDRKPKDPKKHYSIHIDIYEKISLAYRRSFLLTLEFPFLPVHRVAVQLNIPRTTDDVESCSSQQCVHGQCIKYSDNPKGITFCQCYRGWSGRYCTISHHCTCSPDSLCIGILANNRSLCVCPMNKWGSRCLFRSTICHSNQNTTCYNGGQCMPTNEHIISNKKFKCICQKGFTGDRCEIADTKIIISFRQDMILPSSLLVHFIQVIDGAPPTNGSTFKMIPINQKELVIHWSYPFHIVFIQLFDKNYYLITVQKSYHPSTTIVREIQSSDRCPYINEVLDHAAVKFHLLRRIKYYHLPCERHLPPVSCFYDDNYFCLCDDYGQHRVANCFEFNYTKKFDCFGQSNCENGAQCLQDRSTCPQTSTCVCQTCFYGRRCQFSSHGFGLSLDAILGYHIQPHIIIRHQTLVVQLSIVLTIIMTVAGLINSTLLMIAINNKEPCKIGCGIYLISTSITSLFTMLITTIHDPIHRRLIDDDNDDDEKRIWCIVTYSSNLQTFNTVLNIFHFLTPFIINLISGLVIIIMTTRRRTAVRANESFRKMLQKQFQEHSHLLITPILLVILAIPRLIISLISRCMKSINDPWLFLIGYFISFMPSVLTFVVFVLPSQVYKQEFWKAYARYKKVVQIRLHLVS